MLQLKMQIEQNRVASPSANAASGANNRNTKKSSKWLRSCLLIACAGATMQSALADPIGYIDGVRKKNESWAINGWACEPGASRALQVRLLLNDVPVGVPQFSNEPAEDAVHQLCGTAASSGVPYRFTIHYNGPIAGQNIRIDATSVADDANKTPRTAALNGSNEFGLPVVDPESVIASAQKILVLTAHEDDEIWFSPVIGKYCGSAGKTCRVVATTSNRSYHPDANEFVNAMAYLPAVYDIGTFDASHHADSPQSIVARWNAQAAEFGLRDLNSVVRLEIDKFAPDVILTFDPRHGTSCHSEHRAVGQAVIDGVAAYTGTNFNKANLFLLESRRIDLPEYSASIPAAPKDRFSVVYEMMNYMPAKSMTGVDFFINMMGKYPSQFKAAAIQQVLKADKSDMVISLLPIAHYDANDRRYTDSPADARISTCSAFTAPSSTPVEAPRCASMSFSPASLPSAGGTVSVQAHCTDRATSFAWTVDGASYPGNLTTNSAPVPPNSSASAKSYEVCATASNASGQDRVCSRLVQAGVAPVAAPYCSPVTLMPNSLPASGGNVFAQANCSGSNLSYIWSVNGATYIGNQATNSSPVGPNTTTEPIFYAVCVVASNSAGESRNCAQLTQAASVPIAPVCSSLSLTPSNLPASGGTVSAVANCTNSGQGIHYTWSVDGAPFPAAGPQSVTYQPRNSGQVGANPSTAQRTFGVCVVANDSNGQSQPACKALSQAGATSLPPSAPTIGTATGIGNGSISVSFTPGAMGTGALVYYTANCGRGPVTGTRSPIVVSGLVIGQQHLCKVMTTTTAGTSPWSSYSNITVP